MQMMSNAAYIQRELPKLELPEPIITKIKAVCESLIDTKHDVMTELFELADETQTDASNAPRKVQRIVQWLSEPIGEMHQLVTRPSGLPSDEFPIVCDLSSSD